MKPLLLSLSLAVGGCAYPRHRAAVDRLNCLSSVMENADKLTDKERADLARGCGAVYEMRLRRTP